MSSRSRRARVLTAAYAAGLPLIGLSFRSDGHFRARVIMNCGRIDATLIVQRPTLFDPAAFACALTGALGHEPPPGSYARALELARRSQSIE
jgi:hypothetical protein